MTPPPGRVRAASVADLPRLVSLEAALFDADAWGGASLRAELDGPGRRLVVLEEAGAVVAYAATMLAGDVVDLLRIGVAPEARRRGHATTLLHDVRRHGRAAGADRLLLEVSRANAGAAAFYRDAGMEVLDTRPRYYRDGSDALVLRLPLITG